MEGLIVKRVGAGGCAGGGESTLCCFRCRSLDRGFIAWKLEYCTTYTTRDTLKVERGQRKSVKCSLSKREGQSRLGELQSGESQPTIRRGRNAADEALCHR